MSVEKIHIESWVRELTKNGGEGHALYFLGIGGIGMSALARFFNSLGVKVSGYDKTETALTKALESEGMHIHYTDDIKSFDVDSAFVIYTPAVPKDLGEWIELEKSGIQMVKRSEVLGAIINANQNICIAGTHGKTTTSTMVAHILQDSGFGCTAFLGGISSNENSNYWSSNKLWCVAEADEYDRSFLKLDPYIAVITAMDPDHLDIYGDENQFADAFLAFGNKVRANGFLLVNYGLTESFSFSNPGLKTYSLKDKRANSYVKNWVVNDGVFHFDVVVDGKELSGFKLPMGGSHNLENALAAITVATIVGIEEKRIKDAVANFKGVKRRFEYIFSNAETVMIDDYAHHPKELNALVRGVREMHPTRKITIVFQPHLFSRTRDFADGFASALNEADEVLLLPIYPARELPIEGVKSEMLAEKMDTGKVICCEKKELENLLKQKKEKGQLELLVMAGAGDIDALIEPIKYALN